MTTLEPAPEAPTARRGKLTAILKPAAAIAIVVFLIATDRLSLDPVRALFDSPATCVALVVLQLAIMLLGVIRWWLILQAIEGRARPIASLLAYTWVGLFVGCVLPSAVATDIVRYRYLRQGDATPAPILTSIVVDRICGVTSLGLLALAFSPRLFLEIAGDRLWIVVAGIVAILAIVVVVARHPTLRRHLDALRSIRPATTAAAIALGFTAHALKCLSLYLIVCAVAPESLTLGALFGFAPVGFVVEALPLAPGGLGTAHLLFEYLFGTAGVAAGASLFNAYFLTRMVVNLGGGLVWLWPRR